MFKYCHLYVENGNKDNYVCKKSFWKSEKATAPGIPRRSPIQVLTGPDVA